MTHAQSLALIQIMTIKSRVASLHFNIYEKYKNAFAQCKQIQMCNRHRHRRHSYVIRNLNDYFLNLMKLYKLTFYMSLKNNCYFISNFQIYMSLIAATLFILPAGIICVCYLVIICTIRNSSRLLQDSTLRSSGSHRGKPDKIKSIKFSFSMFYFCDKTNSSCVRVLFLLFSRIDI